MGQNWTMFVFGAALMIGGLIADGVGGAVACTFGMVLCGAAFMDPKP